MPSPHETLLHGFEIHSTSMIQEALKMGVDVNAPIDGKSPLIQLVEVYYRSPQFSECVRTLEQAGAHCADAGLFAVLLDDADLLRAELHKNQTLVRHRVNIRCAFTPLLGATLLHVAAEFGLINAVEVLLEAGADVEARASFDSFGFNGHTPIFHTVCQHRNHSKPVLQMLLKNSAKSDVRLAGITWGKSFEWETTILDPTPMSYTQAGLLRQFQRDESDVYENIRLLAQASGRSLPADLNVPNKYLRS